MVKKKFYGMKNDYMFKAVLQSSEEVLKNLVSVLLEIDEDKILSCEIQNAFELGNSVDSKDCILDVKVLLNNQEMIDLEVQVKNEYNRPERSLLYWSRSYDSLKDGQSYNKLKRTYQIGILDFTLFQDNPSFYAEYMVKDTKTGYLYSDKLNIRVLDLTKIDAAQADKHTNPKLLKWAKIFKAKSMKELEGLAIGEEVFNKMVAKIKELSEDEKVRLQCQARFDYECRLLGQYELGEKNGIEKGMQLGIELERIKVIMKKYVNGKSIELIAKEMELDVAEIEDYYDIIANNPDALAEEIYSLKLSN